MDLHYSQTILTGFLIFKRLQSPMDLHYSQTYMVCWCSLFKLQSPMDLHYSQTCYLVINVNLSFNPLWIYTTLKLLSVVCGMLGCFNPLWIYTTLKQLWDGYSLMIASIPYGFTLLSNITSYIIGRLWASIPYGFTLLSN